MMDYDNLVGRLRHYTKTEPYYKHTFTQSADAIDTLRRERDEALAAQGYLYIGRDGKPILARDLEDQRDAALALLREAEEALEPFGDTCKCTIDADEDKWRDADHLWESAAAMALCAGDLRRARAVLAKIKEGEE